MEMPNLYGLLHSLLSTAEVDAIQRFYVSMSHRGSGGEG